MVGQLLRDSELAPVGQVFGDARRESCGSRITARRMNSGEVLK